MNPPATPLTPFDVDNFETPNSGGSTSSFMTSARRHSYSPMVSPPPRIPILVRDGIAPVLPQPVRTQLLAPPAVSEATHSPHPPPPQAAERAEDETASGAEAEAGPEAEAGVQAGADTCDDDIGENIARYLPAEGEGEPLEEIPVRPGRMFCARQLMWIAQAWYRATENSVVGSNMCGADFQNKIASIYEAYRSDFIDEQAEVGGLSYQNLAALYKVRTAKSIYNKWLQIQRAVLDFISYIKTRGERPSGFSTDEDWHKKLQQSFVDTKNAQLKSTGKRDKFSCPGLLDLRAFLIECPKFAPSENEDEATERREVVVATGRPVRKTSRPIGVKAAKADLTKKRDLAELLSDHIVKSKEKSDEQAALYRAALERQADNQKSLSTAINLLSSNMRRTLYPDDGEIGRAAKELEIAEIAMRKEEVELKRAEMALRAEEHRRKLRALREEVRAETEVGAESTDDEV